MSIHVCFYLFNYLFIYLSISFANEDAKGQFTYWSQRTFARPSNKGLRLDYFICSKDMFRKEEKEETMTLMIKNDDDGGNDVDPDVIDKEDTRRTVSVVTATSTIASSQVTSHNGDGDVIATTNTTTTTLKSPIVYDCYIIHQDTIGVSDHCPVMLVLQL